MSQFKAGIKYPAEQIKIILLLAGLDVPVGHTVPDGVVHAVAGFGETVALKLSGDVGTGGVQFADNPVICQSFGLRRMRLMAIANLVFDKASNIPQFVGKITPSDDLTDAKGLVLASATVGDNTQSKRIRSV